MTRTALITGASSGIGEAFADVFAANGFDLVLTARREDRLRAVADRIRQTYGRQVHIVVADLARPGAVARLTMEVASQRINVDALVNNAGYGVPGAYMRSSWEEHDAFIKVMVSTVAELTHRVLPGMLEREYGRIINVASLAGLIPPPAGHTLYAAAKAFVVRFSESLGQEVGHRGVNVTALCPGFTFSEFHDVTGTRDSVSKLPSFFWMDAATVARQGFDGVMAGRPVVITGRVNQTINLLVRMFPQRLTSAINRKLSKAYRKV
jgi:short-subunit dehydrogenase